MIREAESKDIKYIFDIDNKNFIYEKYTLLDIDRFVNKFNRNDCVLVIDLDKKIIRYIIFRLVDNFIEIFKICILNEYRKNGFGTQFIKYIVDNFNEKVNRLILEVRSKNEIAINFYEKVGFKKILTKKDYYENPIDDAIIFEKNIKV